MSNKTDLLEAVIESLQARTGSLRAVAEEAGLSYDTVLRIKARESDPGYSKVRRLADVLRVHEARDAACP
jgi:transcriptional regulator with XRE-family HTH domain